MAEGIVYKAISGFYYVEANGETAECRARGRFRLEKNSPLVGDRVEYMSTGPGKGYLTSILTRRNEFVRPPVANIDTMIIVASAAIPVTDPYLIDRMTVNAHHNDCRSVICINKRDLDPAESLFKVYSAAGFQTVRTSAETGEGLDELLTAMQGGVCALTGNSGVGKSSILNMLDSNFGIATGEVSKKLGRGRHTTRHVELFRLSGGALIADTPGFSTFDTDKTIAKEDLQYLFPEFDPYIGLCRFSDCAHITEPDCAILEALENRAIMETRHASYVRLYKLASLRKEWEL